MAGRLPTAGLELVMQGMANFQSNMYRVEYLINGLSGPMQKVDQTASQAWRSLGVFGSVAAMVGGALALLAKPMVTEAAYAEQMGKAVDIAGKAMGVASADIESARESIARLPITTREGTESIAELEMAGLGLVKTGPGLKDFGKLAQVSMDLAAISGKKTTDVLDDMTRAVTNASIITLRSYGITAPASKIFGMYGETIGKTADQLSIVERRQALLNYILQVGSRINGLYQASQDTVLGQLRELVVNVTELGREIGQSIMAPVKALLKLLNQLLENLRAMDAETKQIIGTITAFGAASLMLVGSLTTLVPVISIISTAFNNLPRVLGNVVLGFTPIPALFGKGTTAMAGAARGLEFALVSALTAPIDILKNFGRGVAASTKATEGGVKAVTRAQNQLSIVKTKAAQSAIAAENNITKITTEGAVLQTKATQQVVKAQLAATAAAAYAQKKGKGTAVWDTRVSLIALKKRITTQKTLYTSAIKEAEKQAIKYQAALTAYLAKGGNDPTRIAKQQAQIDLYQQRVANNTAKYNQLSAASTAMVADARAKGAAKVRAADEAALSTQAALAKAQQNEALVATTVSSAVAQAEKKKVAAIALGEAQVLAATGKVTLAQKAAGNIFTRLWAGISLGAKTALGVVGRVFTGITTFVKDTIVWILKLPFSFGAFVTYLGTFAALVAMNIGGLKTALKGLPAAVKNLFNNIAPYFAALWLVIKDGFNSFASWLNTKIGPQIQKILGDIFVLNKANPIPLADRLGFSEKDVRRAQAQIGEIVDFRIDPGKFFMGGLNIMVSFGEGLMQGAAWVIEQLTSLLNIIASMLIGSSPPPAGPLQHIDEGGKNVLLAWLDGFKAVNVDNSLQAVANSVKKKLQAIEDNLGVIEFNIKVSTLGLDKALYPLQDALALAQARAQQIIIPLKAAERAIERQIRKLEKKVQKEEDSLHVLEQEEKVLDKELDPLQDQLTLITAEADKLLIPLRAQERALNTQLDEVQDLADAEDERYSKALDALNTQKDALQDLVDADQERVDVLDWTIFIEEQRNKVLGKATSAKLLALKSEKLAAEDQAARDQDSADALDKQIDTLESERDAVKENWQLKIDALQGQLDLINKQISAQEEIVQKAQDALDLATAYQQAQRVQIENEKALHQEKVDEYEYEINKLNRKKALLDDQIQAQEDMVQNYQDMLDLAKAQQEPERVALEQQQRLLDEQELYLNRWKSLLTSGGGAENEELGPLAGATGIQGAVAKAFDAIGKKAQELKGKILEALTPLQDDRDRLARAWEGLVTSITRVWSGYDTPVLTMDALSPMVSYQHVAGLEERIVTPIKELWPKVVAAVRDIIAGQPPIPIIEDLFGLREGSLSFSGVQDAIGKLLKRGMAVVTLLAVRGIEATPDVVAAVAGVAAQIILQGFDPTNAPIATAITTASNDTVDALIGGMLRALTRTDIRVMDTVFGLIFSAPANKQGIKAGLLSALAPLLNEIKGGAINQAIISAMYKSPVFFPLAVILKFNSREFQTWLREELRKTAFVQVLRDFFSGDVLTKLQTTGKELFLALGRGITDAAASWATSIESWAKGVWESIVSSFKKFFGISSPSTLMASLGAELIAGVVKGINDWLAANAAAVWQAFTGVVDTLAGAFDSVTSAGKTLESKFSDLYDYVNSKVTKVFSDFGGVLSNTVQAAIETLTNFWVQDLHPALTKTWDFITRSLLGAWDDLSTAVGTTVLKAAQDLEKFWSGTFKTALNDIWSLLTINLNPAVLALKQAWAGVKTYGIDPVVSAFTDIITKVTDPDTGLLKIIGDLATKISGAFLTAWKDVGTYFKDTFQGILDKLVEALKTISGWASGIIGALQSIIDLKKRVGSSSSSSSSSTQEGGAKASGYAGVVTQATRFTVGEAGPEMLLIMPLKNMVSQMSKALATHGVTSTVSGIVSTPQVITNNYTITNTGPTLNLEANYAQQESIATIRDDVNLLLAYARR